MLHYNFPPFSVGEVRRPRRAEPQGCRSWDTGQDAQSKRCCPTRKNFDYTIRLVSEVLESNGSSSMGTVCSASMALMDGGVPIKAPVSGIAMVDW